MKFGSRSKKVFFIAAGLIHYGEGRAGLSLTKEAAAKTKRGQLHSETRGAKESKGTDDIPSEVPFLSEQNIATCNCDEHFHVEDITRTFLYVSCPTQPILIYGNLTLKRTVLPYYDLLSI